MTRSSQYSVRRPLLPLTLLTCVLVGSMTGCARPAASTQAEPEPEPQTEAADASIQAEPDSVPEPATTAADLTAREVEKRRNERIANLLETRTPGVRVTVHADGSLSIRVRGASSFVSGTAPLIVVDGTPVRFAAGGRIRGLNPHDIQSIEVLKDPTDTALYGVRGANGVVIITTLRPMN